MNVRDSNILTPFPKELEKVNTCSLRCVENDKKAQISRKERTCFENCYEKGVKGVSRVL